MGLKRAPFIEHGTNLTDEQLARLRAQLQASGAIKMDRFGDGITTLRALIESGAAYFEEAGNGFAFWVLWPTDSDRVFELGSFSNGTGVRGHGEIMMNAFKARAAEVRKSVDAPVAFFALTTPHNERMVARLTKGGMTATGDALGGKAQAWFTAQGLSNIKNTRQLEGRVLFVYEL